MSRSWHIQISDKLVTVAMVMRKPFEIQDFAPIGMIFCVANRYHDTDLLAKNE